MIPPTVALAAVIFWNVSRWHAVSTQETQVRVLREGIEAARSSGGRANGESAVGAQLKPSTAAGREPISWKNLSGRMAEMRRNLVMGDVREMIRVQQRVAEMTHEELRAALDEIAALNLDPEARKALEEILIGPLIKSDPEFVLTTFADRIPDEADGVGARLSAALGAWAKKDPAAAIAWFDKQIAAGVFDSKSLDGRSQARMNFESALAGVLLSSDLATVSQRIAALPEDQRREALERIEFSELSPTGQKAYADLVRGLVPQDERAGSFTHVISNLMPESGYAGVETFLNDIQATPEERAVSAREAANTRLEEIAGDRAVTREDVDTMRDWLERQAPGTADRVTGEALADAAQEGAEFSFSDASKLVLEYHQSTGNDDMLVAFIESFAARSNLELALPLADKIMDAQLRQDLLARLK